MKTHPILNLVALLALCSCGDSSSAPATPPPAAHAHSSLLRDIPAADSVADVGAARALPPGTPVIVRGRLIGASDVFATRQAMLILGDPAYVKPNFDKPKPHLACCTPAEIKAAHTLTAQAVGSDGLPLPGTLKGLGGLQELDYVLLQGVMAPDSTPQAPVLNFSAIQKTAPWEDAASAPACPRS